MILASITDHSNKALENVFCIQTALLEIMTLTSPLNRRDKGNGALVKAALENDPQHLTSVSPSSNERASFTHSPKDHTHSTRASSHVYSTHNTSAATLVNSFSTATHPLMETLGQLGSTEEEVLVGFCELVLDTVSKMVSKSHDQLLSCLWANEDSSKKQGTGHLQEHDSSISSSRDEKMEAGITAIESIKPDKRIKVVTFDLPNSPGKATSSVELESELINSISHTILLPETPQMATPLQLQVEVHFLIPQIRLRPNMDDIHAHLSKISAALVQVLHSVKWWVGPAAGKSLYEVFEAKGKLLSFHESIAQAIKGQFSTHC